MLEEDYFGFVTTHYTHILRAERSASLLPRRLQSGTPTTPQGSYLALHKKLVLRRYAGLLPVDCAMHPSHALAPFFPVPHSLMESLAGV